MIYWHNFTAHNRTALLHTFAPLYCTRSHHFTAHIHTTLLHTFGAPRKAHLRLNLAFTFSNIQTFHTSFNLTPILHVLYACACGGEGGGGSPSTLSCWITPPPTLLNPPFPFSFYTQPSGPKTSLLSHLVLGRRLWGGFGQ